jgi:5-methyltetrahydropteroyltriglutamate--homocysteine methyltransferase
MATPFHWSDGMSVDRILTTHVGSLPRSADVVALLTLRDQGEPYDAQEFRRTMAAAVEAHVARQRATGIDIPSDGETSKVSYSTYIKDRLSGFAGDQTRQIALDLVDFPEFRNRMQVFSGKQSFKRQVCVGPVAVVERDSLRHDIEDFATACRKHDVERAFLNSASPGVVAAFQPNRFYPTHSAYIQAIAAAMQEEYEAIAAAGFDLQLDCPDLAMARHTGFQDLTESEFLARASEQVEVMNHALRNIPPERLRMHVCWGNYEGPHDHDIDLEKILPIVLRARPAQILFEAANPRHAHEWAVWKAARIPEEKILVPGLLTSTSNYVEHPELIAQRVQQFADIVGRERVIAGTDCGFGTFAGIGKMDPEISWRKLASLVEGARRATDRLWSRGTRPAPVNQP